MFSVMIPCHNPDLTQLGHALSSVAWQRQPHVGQVCVVDDYSRDRGGVAAMAAAYGAEVIRLDSEHGGVATHNVCYASAREDFVHVLHPDDWMLGGFYAAMRSAIRQTPDRALYACHAVYVNEAGLAFAATSGAWCGGADGREFLPLEHGNPLCVNACVVRRSFFLEHGGWDPRLYHTADWEYWLRATVLGGACGLDTALAVFRRHARSHSSRLARTGANLRNFLDLADVVEGYAQINRPAFLAHVVAGARKQADDFARQGDHAAADANTALAAEVQTLLAGLESAGEPASVVARPGATRPQKETVPA